MPLAGAWGAGGRRGGGEVTPESLTIIFGVAHIRKTNRVIHDGRLDPIISVILDTEIN